MLFLLFKVFWGEIILILVLMMITFPILFVIIKKPVIKEENRKRIVQCYTFFYRLTFIIMMGVLVTLQLIFLIWLYKKNYYFIGIISASKSLASYLALTVSLISIVPITLCILKILKKKQYIDSKSKKNNQDKLEDSYNYRIVHSLYYSLINKVIDVINKFPFMGIIHIINMILVIAANIIKTLNIDTELTTTSIYMGIATFYAIDKVLEYFKKKYPELWKKVDNKIFLTEEINQKIEVEIKDIFSISKQMFTDYINTGKFEMSEKLKSEFLAKKSV